MRLSVSETELVKMILMVMKVRKEDLDNKIDNGKKVLDTIRSDFVRLAFITHSFDITLGYVRLSLAANLLNNFFEKRMEKLVPQEMRSGSRDIPASMKETLARELGGLDVSKHFDNDYILVFENLKKDLTTYQNFENADETTKTVALNKVTTAVFDAIAVSSNQVVDEIDEKVGLFLNEAIQALETEQSLGRFGKELGAFAARLHKEIYGWPSGVE